jgi:predicted nucleotide-binding protein
VAKSRKPRVFVGSSGESLRYAYAVKKTLTALGVDVTVWQEDVFKVSSYALESLFQAAWAHDFAVFIFADDDVVIKRKHRQKAVRDNVLFELGLFMGRLGRERTFVATPKGVDLALPSDLAGWTVARYNPALKSAVAAMKGASRQICEAIRMLGNFDPAAPTRDVAAAAAVFERASSGLARHFDQRALSVIRPIGSLASPRRKAPSGGAASRRRPSKR